VITGMHAIVYAEDAAATRAFFRDVLGWAHVDAGGGWLIFATPPSELGVHPAEGGIPHGQHQLFLMCDDIQATTDELKAKGVAFTSPITNAGFGLMTALVVPGGGTLGLYQPRHPVANTLKP